MDNGSSKPSRIGRMVLENWRNFRQVDAQLQRRTFLVGPNASGKSNLLDALRFLRHLVRVGGGFQDALASRGGVSRLRCLSARRHPDIRIHVGILGDDGTEAWTYELAFGQDNLRRGKIHRECITRHGTVILDRPDSDDQADPERLTQTRIEQVQANQEFREIAAFFGSIQYRHLVPQLVREPDRSVGRRDDPFGGDFLEQIAATSSKTRDSRLRRIGQALRIAVPQLKELELTRDSRGVPHLRGKYEHWRPKGSWQFEEDFSDGTLRLLGLLWSILDRSGPLLLEEPELSLHSGIVRLLPQLFARVQKRSGRQIVISTHSPELFQDSGVGLDEVLLLTPSSEGTQVRNATEVRDIGELLAGGVSLADAIMPHTRPRGVERLTLWDG